MTRVVAQLEERDDYEMGVTPVAFVGVSDTYVTVEGFEKVKNIIGVGIKTPISQDTSKTTYNVYESYFKYVLNYPINMCPDELHKELKESEEVEAMPSFPSKGCIEMIDGGLVVKMGVYGFSRDEEYIPLSDFYGIITQRKPKGDFYDTGDMQRYTVFAEKGESGDP